MGGLGVGETTDRRSERRKTSTCTELRQRMSPCSHQTMLSRATTHYASGRETRRARGIVGPTDSPRSMGFEVTKGSCSKPLRIDPSVERRLRLGVERSIAAMLWSSPCASSASRRVYRFETPEENELVDPRGVLNLDLVLLLSEGSERLEGVAGVIGVMGDDGERERGLPESTLAVSDFADSCVGSVGTTGTKVRCCWRSGWTGG